MTKKKTSRAGVRVSSTRPSAGSTTARKRVSRKTQSEQRTPKPKTAYDLLERVCEHILEEPRRYYQRRWALTDDMDITRAVGAVPSCGTTACRAGWIVALTDGLPFLRHVAERWEWDIGDRADVILGLASDETNRLFSEYGVLGTPGTVAYARLGAKGLRAFMKQHEAHLKARLLKDVPKWNSQSEAP